MEGQQIGIAFNVNDNLSISYSELQSIWCSGRCYNSDGWRDQEIDAIQVAYSMGGMSIKAYQMEVTNPAFDEDADDSKVTEI